MTGQHKNERHDKIERECVCARCIVIVEMMMTVMLMAWAEAGAPINV